MEAAFLSVEPVWLNADSASVSICNVEGGGTSSVDKPMLVVVAGGSREEDGTTATGGTLAVASSCGDVVVGIDTDSVVISVVKTVDMSVVVLVELLSSPALLVSDVGVNSSNPSLVVV